MLKLFIFYHHNDLYCMFQTVSLNFIFYNQIVQLITFHLV